jgi:hypothetical protein
MDIPAVQASSERKPKDLIVSVENNARSIATPLLGNIVMLRTANNIKIIFFKSSGLSMLVQAFPRINWKNLYLKIRLLGAILPEASRG